MTRARIRAMLRAAIVAAGVACAVGLALDVREAMQASRGAWGELARALN